MFSLLELINGSLARSCEVLIAPSSCLLWADRGPGWHGSSSCGSNSADVDPHLKRTSPCSSILAGRDVVAAEMEEVVDLVVGGEEALGLPGRLEPLHLSL